MHAQHIRPKRKLALMSRSKSYMGFPPKKEIREAWISSPVKSHEITITGTKAYGLA